MNPDRKRPNFFVVGAAKCGTTSMHHYLSQHPDIFMPDLKEPHYFASDLEIGPGWRVLEEPAYLNLFENAGEAARIGEASPWYIYSKTAPEEIKKFSPNPQIIVLLRNPADFINSIHLQFLNTDDEDLMSLEDALAAEGDRSAGRRLPPRANFPACLQYRDAARFSSQVKRYFDCFGKENVQVNLLEDLVKDTQQVVAETFAFLGVDEAVQIDLLQKNKSRDLSHLDLALKRIAYNNAFLNNLAHRLPKPILNSYRKATSLLFPTARATTMEGSLRSKLVDEFTSEIHALEQVIDRDLGHWLQPAD